MKTTEIKSIKICEDFYNKVLNELDNRYFHKVKYYRDDKNCEKTHYAVELFNNGVLSYNDLIKKLSKSCNDTQRNIHSIVKKYITDFGDCKFSLEIQHPMLEPDYDGLNRLALFEIQLELKLNNKDFKLLMEAYRRKMEFYRDKAAKHFAWVGLGTPSQYKSVYFTSHDGRETPRVNNWYVLTEKGVKAFDVIVKKFPFPKEMSNQNLINNLLFNL